MHGATTPPRPGQTAVPFFAPFAAYMGLIALEGGLSTLAEWLPVLAPLASGDHLWIYPLKLLIPLALLCYFRSHYSGLNWRPSTPALAASIVTGMVVFALWIQMDWPWATQGDGSEGYNPYEAGLPPAGTWALIGVRLAGAALIVPLFEELFWRGFLMRYLIDSDFWRVPVGRFTPLSFIAPCLLFGVEHHLWLAGIMAGVAYGALICRTRSLGAAVVAHGVTNLALGVWVVYGQHWQFW